MSLKACSLFLVFMLSFGALEAATKKQNNEESQQQISDFSLAGYGEGGKKSWDISGKTADIFAESIRLTDIVGNMYNDKDNIRLTAQNGDFDKTNNKIYLKQDVVVTTSSGAKLTTDSLDWDRKNNIISTEDKVNIERDNMITSALGAEAELGLNKVSLKKDVNLEILPPEGSAGQAGSRLVITCDGKLEINYAKNIATFYKNVLVDRDGSQIYADVMDIYFISDKSAKPKDDKGGLGLSGRIDRIVAHGNVKIVRGANVSYSEEAIYTAYDKKITLTGRPKLIIESTEDFKNASFGN